MYSDHSLTAAIKISLQISETCWTKRSTNNSPQAIGKWTQRCFQTLDDFSCIWKAEGRLLAYKPPGFEAVDRGFKDSEGAFYGVQVIAMQSHVHDTEHVKPAECTELGHLIPFKPDTSGQDRNALSEQATMSHYGCSRRWWRNTACGLNGKVVHGNQAQGSYHPRAPRAAA